MFENFLENAFTNFSYTIFSYKINTKLKKMAIVILQFLLHSFDHDRSFKIFIVNLKF